MAIICKIKGVKEIKARMEEFNKDMSKQLDIGLKNAALYLQRESQKIVPVQMGNLKASAFSRVLPDIIKSQVGISSPSAVVGYTANYAVYVHENLDASHGKAFNLKYAKEINEAKTSSQKRVWFRRGENQQAKFLEAPAREKKDEIFRIIKGSINI